MGNQSTLQLKKRAVTTLDRLRAKSTTNPITGCVEWNGYLRDGYGSLRVNGRQQQAHRVVYELTYGEIPQELFVCHHCDNRPCINPKHLFLGTNKDNVDDKVRKKRHLFGDRHPGLVATQEVRRQIKNLVRSGERVDAIARQLGLTMGTAKKYAALARRELYPSSPRRTLSGKPFLTEETVLQIREDRKQGYTLSQIAHRHGLSSASHASIIVTRRIWKGI